MLPYPNSSLPNPTLSLSQPYLRLTKPKGKAKPCINGWKLEQIPEDMELHYSDSDSDSDADSNILDPQELIDLDLERVRWAVDFGIWVLCLALGVGYLVSKASVRKFRPS